MKNKLSLKFTISSALLTLSFVAFGANSVSDSAVRHGVLENSMSYYIRHNDRPKGQADFYILANVGAIQEEDHQQGLAHFLEHMAFNGTENMPDKEIINYLESVGVKFGANLNASTSWDETIYMMKDLPTSRQSIVDSALLILHDWAGAITPREAEIDKERGVIREELRTRDNAGWRSTLSMIETLGRGTRYEERNLIGTLEGLSEFDPQSLLEFYHDWYNPAHQAIIIVGDIDAEYVEQQLIKLMSQLPAASADAPQKEVIKLIDNKKPIINIYGDKEMQYSTINYFIKRHIAPDWSVQSLGQSMRSMIEYMQNARFRELTAEPDAPILGGTVGFGRVGVIPSLDATTYMAQSAEGGLESAMREVVTQMERVRRYGFTEAEVERARQSLLRSAQRRYLNSGDRTNGSYVQQYIDNYLYNQPVRSAHDQWLLDSTELCAITIKQIDHYISTLYTHDNNVVSINTPLKEGLAIPTQEQIAAIIDEVRHSDIEPYDESQLNDQLIPDNHLAKIEATHTTIKRRTTNKQYGTTEYTLSNGIRVTLKPTTLRQDEILMRAESEGGASLVSDDRYYTSIFASLAESHSGIADMTDVDLSRHMAGKIANVSSWTNEYSHGVSGNCSPADLETMMQLLYLRFAAPRFDTTAFNTFKRQLYEGSANDTLSPDYQARKAFVETAYGNHPHQQMWSVEMIDNMHFDDLAPIHQTLYSDGDNFHFIFAGNVDPATFEPLMLRYIGAIPTDPSNRTMRYVDDGVRVVKGDIGNRIDVAMEQPKVQVQMMLSGERTKATLRDMIVSDFLRDALANRLLESVREEQGGSYGVGVQMIVDDKPIRNYRLILEYDTNVEQVDELQRTIHHELEQMAAHGPSDEQVAKSREYMVKNFGNSLENNGILITYINKAESRNHDYIGDYERLVRSISAKDIRRMARTIVAEGNIVECYMYPKDL